MRNSSVAALSDVMRSLSLAIFALVALAAEPAFACRDPSSLRTVVFEAPPSQRPSDRLTLEVRIERIFTRPMPNGTVTHIGQARVLRVVRGHYAESTIDISVYDTSCDSRPPAGTQGFVTGQLRTLPDGSVVLAARSRRIAEG